MTLLTILALPASASQAIVGSIIGAGALTYSKKIMMTVGKGIVPLDPFSALVTVLAEALALHTFTIVLLTGMTAVGFILEYRLKEKLKTYLTHEAFILANVIATMVPQTEKTVTLDSFCRKYAIITDVR